MNSPFLDTFRPYFLHTCVHTSSLATILHEKYVLGKCALRSAPSHGLSSVHVHSSGLHQKVMTWRCKMERGVAISHVVCQLC